MQRLSRRQFVGSVAGLGLLAGCGRLPWQAQQPANVPRVGWLSAGFLGAPFGAAGLDAFREGLGGLGYIEGHNIIIDQRYAEGSEERLPKLAAELAGLKVDLILAVGAAIPHALQTTETIPIVMVGALDPVGSGYVASLARPGGNVTGLSLLSAPLSGKRLELLKEVLPGLSRVAIFWVPGTPGHAIIWEENQRAARTMGLQLQSLEVRTPGDFESAFAAAMRERTDALSTIGGTTTIPHRSSIIEFANRNGLPAIYDRKVFVQDGGLMAYGPNETDQFRRAAYYVDRILKGTKPADLPVEQPMRFDFVVNMKTARELGITFPHEVALQITEVIE
jgi:putative ABC transport system substrate-binding protein